MQLILSLGTGKCSTFGGPWDAGVGPQEGLGEVETVDLSDWWFHRIFEPGEQWKNQYGLARNLNPAAYYGAMRFAYASWKGVPGEILSGFTREQVRRAVFFITANGITVPIQMADWGPDPATGRLIDLSPGAAARIRVKTDDVVGVGVLI